MNDLEELGGTRLLLTNQYNTGIFLVSLLLLPCFCSACRQTNDDNAGNFSADRLWFSRISIAPSSSLCILACRRR